MEAPVRQGQRILFFIAALILSNNPFLPSVLQLDSEDIEDARAKDLIAALKEAEKEGIRDIEGILSFCPDDAAVRFVHEIDASGELSEGLEKIIEDGLARKRKKALEKERSRLVASLQAKCADEDRMQEKSILEKIMRIDEELKKTGGDLDE